MIQQSMQQLSILLQGRLVGPQRSFAGIVTDSRHLPVSSAQGPLFVALCGVHFDGHDFLAPVYAHGICCALVSKRDLVPEGMSAVCVPDTVAALSELAYWWRRQCSTVHCIVVVGSNGKTTTKEMIAHILCAHVGPQQVLFSTGTQNNYLGVPLTLLRLNAQHRYAVIEIGMNHVGEIGPLLTLVQYHTALLTNTLREHLEFLTALETIAQENGQAYDGLPANGLALVNADDPYCAAYQKRIGQRRCLCFSTQHRDALVQGDWHNESENAIFLSYASWSVIVTLFAPGIHFLRNATAAAAVAFGLDIPSQQIKIGLERFRPLRGRQHRLRGLHDVCVIDDSYNANPDSVEMAIFVLAKEVGYRVLVLGDMREVGEHSTQHLHEEIGQLARVQGIDALYAYGRDVRFAVNAFGVNGYFFTTQEALLVAIRPLCHDGVTMLVKGSVVMQMDRIVQALTLPKGIA